MMQENKDILLKLLKQHKELGISEQIDYDKFYLYSIITHSTAIEGSTVTEVEAQLLFDEGITSSGEPFVGEIMWWLSGKRASKSARKNDATLSSNALVFDEVQCGSLAQNKVILPHQTF